MAADADSTVVEGLLVAAVDDGAAMMVAGLSEELVSES